MVYRFSHYTSFDDIDGNYGNADCHVQLCINVEFDTDGGSGTLTIDGKSYDVDNDTIVADIYESYDIQ